MQLKKITYFAFLLCIQFLFAQQTIKGIVLDENYVPLPNATIKLGSQQTTSDYNGQFVISHDSNAKEISISAENYNEVTQTIDSKNLSVTVMLVSNEASLTEVTFQSRRKTDLLSFEVNTEKALAGPSLTGGIEDLLKSYGAVSSNTELSSQYMVRGGNFDENLVYINGVEIYRPFLIRNGQQEGMSIVNPSMTSLVNFSPGGFESKYGDKLSSVLDIYYKKPKSWEGYLEASLLGGGLTLGYGDRNQKFSALVGARYRNLNFILNTLDENTDFNPKFGDVQTYLDYKISPRFSISFLGNVSQNDFEMQPKSRETKFGTLSNQLTLNVLYRGHENDRYLAKNGNLTFRYFAGKKWNISLTAFAFHTQEEEYFDIASSYLLQQVDASGVPVASFDGGGQINHARNDLDMLVTGAQMQTTYKFKTNHTIEFGFKTQKEDIRDFQNEWQLLDSIGYSIPRDPYVAGGNLDDSDLILNYHIKSRNNLISQRSSGFIQYSAKLERNKHKFYINAGVRGTYWDFNNETNISPRVQFAWKPSGKRDLLFRVASGLYYQPPFYKEIRDLDGNLNYNIKSQRSLHFVVGNDYEFELWKRPFKLISDVYYKKLDDIIPYYVDNVRIRYTAENNSEGRVYGIESRLHGEFVPGIESWFSLAYAKAEQNIDNRGNISMPTDPRFKASLFFQDKMPVAILFLKNLKASVNAVYASGLPNGAPMFTDPYDYQSKLQSYKRVDIGISNTFVDSQTKSSAFLFRNLKEFTLDLQIFNVFDIRNTISNQWITDINSGVSIAVPNRLTGRFFNLRLIAKF